MTSTPALQTVIDFYWSLAENADDLCASAELLVEDGKYGLAQTLAIAGEEELGKADDVANWYFALSQGKQHDTKAMFDRWKRHELKFLTAQMADDRRRLRDTGQPPQLPSSLDELVQVATGYYEHVAGHVNTKHAARMAGLYVELVGDEIRRPSDVTREIAEQAIEQTRTYSANLRLSPIPRRVPGRLLPDLT